MKLTDDELVTAIEALEEYAMRMPEGARRILCNALVYRFRAELLKHDQGARND